MEIFLPSEEAAQVKIGSEARITLDYAPGLAAAGYVSFVSPEAQFTPKQVETRSERSKLMFRVKIQDAAKSWSPLISSTSRRASEASGMSRWIESAVWPDWLQNLLTRHPRESDTVIPAKERPKEVP